MIGAVGLTNPAFAGGEPVVNPDGDLFRGQTSSTLPSLEAAAGATEITLTYKPDGGAEAANSWRYRMRSGEEGYTNADGVENGWQTPVSTGDVNTGPTLLATNKQVVTGLQNGTTYYFQAETIVTSGGAVVSGSRAPATGSVTSTPNDPPARVNDLKAVTGPGSVTLTWTWERAEGGLDATGFEYIRDVPNGHPWTTIPGGKSARSFTVTGLEAGESYRFRVRAVAGDNPPSHGGDQTALVSPSLLAGLDAGSSTTGSNTSYVITFNAPADLITGGRDEVVIKMEDFSIPSTVRDSAISVRGGTSTTTSETASPAAVDVDDDELKLTLRTGSDDFVDEISEGVPVTIRISQGAGIRNPTEWDDEANFEITWGDSEFNTNAINLYRKISLSENAGGRGDVITATGKGFKNGQGITFWLDRDGDNVQDAGEDVLCTGTVGSDDVGSCDFSISNPPFNSGVGDDNQVVREDDDGDNKCGTVTGCNLISAVDGRGNKAHLDSEGRRDDATFELEASIMVTPSSASYGESVQIQMTDFAEGRVTRVAIAGDNLLENQFSGNADDQGNGNFTISIPNDAPTGVQDLRVWTAGSDARTTITVNGPTIRVNPSNIVANQRVSVIGSGFTPGAYVCCEKPAAHSDEPRMSIGGEVIPTANINDGRDVLVDNGGNWSAAVDMPLVIATTSEGDKTLRITDTQGRDGEVTLSVPARQVTITPDTGRLGTTAVVRGQNFPGKNDDGVSYSLEVAYKIGGEDATRVTATPDASGTFEVELRVPTSATIPSTNSVEVRFNAGASQGNPGTPVITTVTHEVPEGTVSLSESSGSAGSTVTVTGGGFKNFVPVTLVRVGNLEVTPSPRPSTDAQGETSFDITIPGLDVGIQTVEVRIGDTTASIGFTVTPSGIAAGDITPSAEAVANLGDAFVRSFHFNNDTKAWTFYDPAAGDASSQENFISGETYWVLVSATTEAILNGKTRNMTCVSGNCWNQIVW